jgi:uncharacterized protein YukJ
MESAVLKAIDQAGSMIYAFGARWGPETNKKDKYFKFTPGNGIHDIHMNQGNDKRFAKDDGVFHDGCLIFQYPGGKYRAFFLVFQSQTFDTDDKTGHAKRPGAPGKPPTKQPKKRPVKKRKKPATKKR